MNDRVFKPSRRRFFAQASAATAGLAVAAGAGRTAQAVNATEGLAVYQLGPRIWIRLGEDVLTCYRAHPSQKYPYFYPLVGPVSGLPLTVETSDPYPHHRSLWLACDKVNGGNYWQEGYGQGQIVSKGPTVATPEANRVVITDACAWKRPGAPSPCQDSRIFEFSRSGRGYTLDVEIRWTALENMTIPRTNHSLFSMRAATDLAATGGGTLMSASGAAGADATFGKPAKWMAFFGKRRGDGPVEGIAIMDHPENMDGQTPWFTRDYGFASPTPLYFREKAFMLPKGETVILRYRVAAFTGDPQAAGLDDLYKNWLATSERPQPVTPSVDQSPAASRGG